MKPIKIALFAGMLTLSIVGVLYFMTTPSPKTSWVISGGEKLGMYDEVAHSLATALKGDSGTKVTVQNSSGSKQNLDHLQKRISDLCLVQNDIAGKKGFTSIATLYEEALHVVVRTETGSLQELANGTFSLGPLGGGTEGLALAALRQAGFEKNEITLRKESFESGIKALREKRTDAVCIVTSIGNRAVHSLLREGEFALLDFGEKAFEGIRYSYPFAHTCEIPSKVYPVKPGYGLPKKNISTLGTEVLLVCRQDLPEKNAFDLARFLGDNHANLIRAHPLLAQMDSPKNLRHLQFPVHPGAQLHFDRHEPSFIQAWADPIALVLSVLVIAWGALATIRKIYLMRLKENLDEFFHKVECITSELVEGTKPERSMKIARELHEIRRETTRKLIAEELFADDSFVIFQRQLHTAQQLVNEALRKADEERKNIVTEKDSKNEKSSQA